jgi:uncharacterized membrane protein
MIQLKDEAVANEAFKYFTLPLLNGANLKNCFLSTSRLYSNYTQSNIIDLFSQLAETIDSFKEINVEGYWEKYKNVFLDLIEHNEYLLNLLRPKLSEKIVISSPSIFQLYESCLRYLEIETTKPPQFSWHMPGKINCMKKINTFLHSEKEKLTCTFRYFDDIKEAKEFAKEYSQFDCKRKFSIVIKNMKSDFIVFRATIVKTKEYFEYQNSQFQKILDEYQNLKKFIDDNKK